VALLDRHVAFVEALRTAGLPVSLAEDLDAVQAVTTLGLDQREDVRTALAATLVKRQSHRPSFDAVFDLFFPALLGSGVRDTSAPGAAGSNIEGGSDVHQGRFGELRDEMVEAMAEGDQEALLELVRESVERFGAMPGRPRGMSSWSSYNTLQKLAPDTLVLRLAEALVRGSDDREPRSEDLAMLGATRRVDAMRRMVETDVRRRIAEEKDAEYVARTTLRPSLDQIPFVNARKEDVDEMRRQVYPLARRLAARLAKEQHARRRGPLDFRRTVRASVSTGGVPLVTHHRPRRPHRPELVVLCDVSGSVANFASFTLLLVYALREQFGKVRAFTFVDDVHEVTDEFVPGADLEDTLARLAASARHASCSGAPATGGPSSSSWRSTPTR
jgi:uncharacterized protein with von Willebrand factor type A (vWA) domain